MNVWTVIHGNVEDSERDCDCGCKVQQAEIYITVCRNEQAARALAKRNGGIVLFVDAESVGACSEFGRPFSDFESTRRVHPDDVIPISTRPEPQAKHPFPRQAYVTVDCADLRRNSADEYDWTPEAEEYFKVIERALGRPVGVL